MEKYHSIRPTMEKIHELDYDTVVGKDTVVAPTYDPHCGVDGEVSGGCEPVAVISAQKLRDYTKGPKETARRANALHNDKGIGDYVIAPEAWDCSFRKDRVTGLSTIVRGRRKYTISRARCSRR